MHNRLNDAIDLLPSGSIYFVNVGAHIGMPYDDGSGDPLVSRFDTGDWRGVCVEPIPENFAKLKVNLAGREHLRFENGAVSDTDGEIEVFSISHDDCGWSFSDQISTIMPNRGWMAKALDKATSQKVPTFTLKTLMDRHDLPRCDVLKIDTEGAELRILSACPFSEEARKPTIIYYEHRHLPQEERDEARTLLEGHGYTVIEQRHPLDTVAYLSSKIGVLPEVAGE